MFVLISLILLVLAICRHFVQKRYKFWNDRGFVSAPTSFPFGNLKGIGTEVPFSIGLDKIYKNFKGKTSSLGLFFFTSPSLMILDLELLKNVFKRDFSSFHDRGLYYNKKDDPLSANLVSWTLPLNEWKIFIFPLSKLTLEGQEWRDRRVKLSPVFTSGKMKMMFDIVDAIGDKFAKAVAKELTITDKIEVRQLFAIVIVSG